MRLGNVLTFREDLFFEGAVQIDWFYQLEKAAKVSENFVFHGREYFGANEEQAGRKLTDTATFMKLIAQKLDNDQRGNPFTLAVAGYGTGKSHLAVTMAQLLSGKRYMPDTYQKVLKNIARVDSDAAKSISQLSDRPNFVIVLNGMRDFNLHYELLRSAQRSLRLYGYSDDSLKKLNRAIETAFRFFERNAVNNVALFEEKATAFAWTCKGDELINRLREELGNEETAFNIINAAYEQINGHEIRWDEGVSASAVLETLVAEYCGISGEFDKVIVIFDEFGRYLEYASSSTAAHSGDSALQQIFESAQNAEGNIQVINFIQSDIKTYLQRVDQTSNISRYIGRYDASDKYYLSSNLETVFANLIDRKDKDLFENSIKKWQHSHEDRWQNIFTLMSKWLPLKGLWKEYKLFRQVVVEGIYPMHPLSSYMLTQLSDYLQNRSSLTLVNRYISSLSEMILEVEGELPVVLPEMLLDGDLYSEMLSAEQEGRQLSQHCIRFDNILRKYGDKLSGDSYKLLRANLALRILRFRTTDYDDAKKALGICSGLAIESINQELNWLENEYAVIGFDEHAGCFDFLEDSSGAHDFRTFLRRIKAGQALPASFLDDSSVRDMAGVLSPIATNFAFEKKIKSNEWQFEQDLFSINDLSGALIDSMISEWKNATSPEKIKGKLTWLYINRDSDNKALDSAIRLSKKSAGTPIVLMLLNDAENRLHNAALDYYVLSSVSDIDRNKYGRHFDDAYAQSEENLRSEFDVLKKQRLMITPQGAEAMSKRLGITLVDILSQIYPNTVPFDFDGFDSKQPGRAKKAYCSILSLLLSGDINSNIIHSFSVEIRNRFEATLYETGVNSWKCINSQYQIVPPKEKSALKIYNYLEKKLRANEELNCKSIIEELCMPPFGLNEYTVVYIVAVFCANLAYCLRLQYKDITYSVSNWKDNVVKDNKIDLAVFQKTIIKLVDAGAIVDSYLRLFMQINDNNDITRVELLSKELKKLVISEKVPTDLEAQYRLCEYKLQEGQKIIASWNNNMESIMDKVATAEEKEDVYQALLALQMVESSSTYAMFTGDYKIAEDHSNEIRQIKNRLRSYLEQNILPWIKKQKCQTIEAMTQYEKHIKRIESLLKSLGYFNEANAANTQGEKELNSRAEIQARQELKANCQKFLSEKVLNQHVAYTALFDWEKQGNLLLEQIEKFRTFLGEEAEALNTRISRRVNEIVMVHQKTKRDMDDIWNDIYELVDIDSVESMIERIDHVCKKGIATSDRDDFIALKVVLAGFLDDIKELQSLKDQRKACENQFLILMDKYTKEDLEVDVSNILSAIGESLYKNMDLKDKRWEEKYIASYSGKYTRKNILEWIDETTLLPGYLSEATLEKYRVTKLSADKSLSEANIEDVVFHFTKLNIAEREECLTRLTFLEVKAREQA